MRRRSETWFTNAGVPAGHIATVGIGRALMARLTLVHVQLATIALKTFTATALIRSDTPAAILTRLITNSCWIEIESNINIKCTKVFFFAAIRTFAIDSVSFVAGQASALVATRSVGAGCQRRMALIDTGGTFVVLDASLIIGRRRMDESWKTVASIGAARVDADRVGAATVPFRPAFRFAFVNICRPEWRKEK